MQQTLQPCLSLDPEQSLRNKELYMKLNRGEESWKKFHHKHTQVFGQMFQLEEKGVNEDLPLKRPKSRKRGDADNLWKHLWRSRQLVSAVKQGSSYFQLLKEQEEKKNEKRRKKEEKRIAELHHPSSTSDSDDDRRSVHSRVSSSPWRQSNRRRDQRLRPFTPVHQSLTSDQLEQLSAEHVYRQLCCLCWLLEALTLGRSAKFGPVASCWDARDPGRSRNIPKAVYREKLIQAKWERFISPPKTLRPGIRLSHITSLTHKSLALSAMSSSVLTTSMLGNMSSSDITYSGEESESLSIVMSEPDPPISKYLQVLLDEVHQSISKDLYGSTTDYSCETDIISFEKLRAQYNTQDNTVTGKLESHTAKSCLNSQTSTVFSQEKVAMLAKMKMMFKERSRELSLNLTDTLDLKAKKRWMSGVQRYHSLSNMSVSRGRPSSVPCVTPNPQVQESDTPDTPYSTQWISALLRSLPSHTHSDRKLVCVVEKLKRYTQERTLRIRPHIFFRVLNSLQPWELCCPELCVAIEIVRENAVRISADEYDCWLHAKVNFPHSVKARR